jgi:hypothetical protein
MGRRLIYKTDEEQLEARRKRQLRYYYRNQEIAKRKRMERYWKSKRNLQDNK